jgi:hypothetical protein
MQILEMIESGKISADQGLRLLQALAGEADPRPDTPLAAENPSPADAHPFTGPAPGNDFLGGPSFSGGSRGEGSSFHPSPESVARDELEPLPPDVGRWQRWWMIPFWAGLAFTMLGGLLMNWALLRARALSLWFCFASLPFLLGILIMALSWQSRKAHWLHLRIQQKPGEWPQTLAFSFPLPLRLAAWFFRTFGDYIPKLQGTSLDEVILALGQSATPENPLYINVDEGDDGERVQIFIG